MMNYNFILSHGWGLTDKYWDPFIKYFPQYQYLSAVKQTDGKLIGVGHSLGLIKLLQSGVNFTALISLNSFVNFLGSEKRLHTQRLIKLNKMIKSFKKDPEKTLDIFFTQCDISDHDIAPISENLLHELESLKNSYELPNIPTLVIAGKNDKIVPPKITYDNFANKGNVKIIMSENAQHNMIANELLYEEIRKFLDEINEKDN